MMNQTLESNRAYQFAKLESAMQAGRREEAQAILAKLRRLGVEVRLSADLLPLIDQSNASEGAR